MENIGTAHQNALREFILLWGEMASSWGINRTMAQIHALLYASEEPKDTDEIMQSLKISRGNANVNLRMLLSWNLIKKVHQMGSRRDYYTAEKDVWKLSTTIIKERQRREIKPIRETLETNLSLLEADKTSKTEEQQAAEKRFKERLKSFIDLLTLFEEFADAVIPFIADNNIEQVKLLAQLASNFSEE